MKPYLITLTFAVSLLLTATPDAQASPPRQHSAKGLIDTIDCASRTITLKSKDGATPLTLVWNHSTRFTKKGGCAKCGLDSGQSVHAWYRREVGQNVVRKVSTTGASTACGRRVQVGIPNNSKAMTTTKKETDQ